MTHKIALSLALFASLGLTACTVDSPTPEDFNYSFLEELPGSSAEFNEPPLRSPATSHIVVSFRDSLHGTDDVDASVAEVVLAVKAVQLSSEDEEGKTQWGAINKELSEMDLLELADGATQELANGPFPEGHYTGIAIVLADAQVVEVNGRETPLDLPGRVLYIEEDFELRSGESAEFVVGFGGLRGLERTLDQWATDPNVTYSVTFE